MATSYTHNSYGHSVGYWWFDVSESVNTSNNTSTITVRFYVKAAHNNQQSDTYNNYPAGYGSSTPWAKIWINGTQVADSVPACFDLRYNSSKKIANGTSYLLASASKTIQHNSDGTGSVSIKCQHYTSVSPNNVTLETSRSLTKINTVKTSSWYFPSGTFEIGSTYNAKFTPTSPGLSHHIYIKLANTDWACVAWDKKGSVNVATSVPFVIPEVYRKEVASQSTAYMTIRGKTYNGSTHLGSYEQTVTIKNSQYDFTFDSLKFLDPMKIGSKCRVQWTSTSTFGIVKAEYKVSGALNISGYVDTIYGDATYTIPYEIPDAGPITVTITLVDKKGNRVSKTISGTVEDPKYLYINSLKSNNSALYVIKNDVNSSETRIKATASWDSSSTVTKIEFSVTGANSQTWYKDYPSGSSYTWTSNNVYNTGSNTVTFKIYNAEGLVKTASYNINSTVEPWSISTSNSYVDPKLCVNLVNDSFYANYSRVGVRIKVNHTHDLSYISVTVNNKTYNLPNIDPQASEFTFVCSDYVSVTGNIQIQINAGDINGRHASSTETIHFKALILDPPSKPIIEYEDNVSLLLSEGEKVTFTGSTSSLEDYKIIYAKIPCDIVGATSICNSIEGSYLETNTSSLNNALLNNEQGSLSYFILKDFGEKNTFITQDNSNSTKFHIHPLTPDHKKFYALQWFNELNPGDSLYLYVIERRQGTFEMLYSDERDYKKVPKTDMFHMCIIPPGPCPLSIYLKEQTKEKIVIEYTNPIYDMNLNNKDAVHLIDVCLVARDSKNNIIDKADYKKRDGLNGKTWVHYSQRQWHNVFTHEYGNKNNYYTANRYTMEFDLSKYPESTSLCIIAFYYTDYFNHPSIYSASNMIITGKQALDLELSFIEPKNNESIKTANPKISALVKNVSENTMDYSAYDSSYNLATKWDAQKWKENPIWISIPGTKDSQVPNFRINDTNEYYFKNLNKEPINLNRALNSIEFYNLHKDIYTNKDAFKISELKADSSGVFIENCLFLRLNDNVVKLGDIYTDEILLNGQIIYDWQQDRGRFLSIGKNKLELYTCPYEYGKRYIQYNEIDGKWLSEGMFMSNPVMPYNYYADSIVRPADKDNWDEVEGDILEMSIPYKLLKPNFSYNLNYSFAVDKGFFYDDVYMVDQNQINNDLICNTYVFHQVVSHDDINVSQDNDIYTDLIYRPAYTVIDNNTQVDTINKYNQWINKVITFTTPSELVMESSQDKNLVIKIRVRGAYRTKIKDISLISIDKQHIVDEGRLELDTTNIENKISIVINYSLYDFNFAYINPLDYDDMIQLRDYLFYLADIYNIQDFEPAWRPLIRDHSYLMAQDFNDMRASCIDLFEKLSNKYPDTFKGNISEFTNLPIIKAGERRGLTHLTSTRGKSFFPEWDDLIDAIKNQSKK